ncbi:LysM peptidoglycan-binding domain-containing protein [Bacillus pumilus]|uniref:LysM peptidoglycan-binding domain-containing protein n=1 Tax=Bacillus pumilus TaxID=1408 RepID=UPI00209D6476|nr:LysM peptidoglycan-binding domain-containing protein [Bacillus pumilus]MCP1529257.1 stage VI sporulation protein D [Bacillus pumilus]MDF9784641.1 stage VI sporulation protein D [Bacillus pumilus]
MSQNNRLQFSVEESIYFKSGQEVSELLSISLDPDILVQEVNDYVSIRGSLELTGEYNINQEELLGELSSYASYREADEVKVREDGTAELLHQFPVDITIPKNKISHLNDVFVFIDAFDYQLTENRLLTIQADLAIEGLLDEEMPQAPVEEPYEFVHRSEEEYGDVTYDYQLQPEDEEQEELQGYEHEIDEDQAVLQHDTRAEEEKQEEEIEIELVSREEETEELEESESQEEVALGYRSLPEAQVQEPPFFEPPKLLEEEKREDTFFEVEVRKDPEAAEELEETVQPYPVFESPAYHVEEEQEAQDDTYQLGRLYEREAPKVYESAQEEEAFEEDVRETSGSENSLYLTKLFAKQEEEDFSRMKICIVQQEDTVDRICERYQLNVQQLLRTNSLSVDAELEEGQILYIPEYQKSNA